MSFTQDLKHSSRNYSTLECQECHVLIGYYDLEWIDGLSDIFCVDCFTKKNYPINEKIWVVQQTTKGVNK